ncbi:MAG: EF-hand domain-containing protein [Planctomycetia bacterium]|nr:EF-hand domain-containing protein [Planctomycetia bacterium]
MRQFAMWTLAVVCVFGLSRVAGAQDPPKKAKPTPQQIFDKLDTNHDGKLSLEEYKANPRVKSPEEAEKRFAKFDTDGDKSVTLEEFKAGIEKLASHKKEGKKEKKN